MTRINVGIDPSYLTDEHLLAEHREIKRMCSLYEKNKDLSNKRIPTRFTLNTGHMLFFLDKPSYTLQRYRDIHQECIQRGFNVPDYSDNWRVYNNVKGIGYIPSSYDKSLLVQRISMRINESPKKFFHYKGEQITKENAIKLLKNE